MSIELLYAMRDRLRVEFETEAARHKDHDQGNSLTAGDRLTPEGYALVLVGLLANVPIGCPGELKLDDTYTVKLSFTYRSGYTGGITMSIWGDKHCRLFREIPAGWSAVTVRLLVKRFIETFYPALS